MDKNGADGDGRRVVQREEPRAGIVLRVLEESREVLRLARGQPERVRVAEELRGLVGLVDDQYVVRAQDLPATDREILGEQVAVQIAKRSELRTFQVMPKRWIVERSFAWLEKNRRLWKNCERWLNTSLQFVHLAFLALILRRS